MTWSLHWDHNIYIQSNRNKLTECIQVKDTILYWFFFITFKLMSAAPHNVKCVVVQRSKRFPWIQTFYTTWRHSLQCDSIYHLENVHFTRHLSTFTVYQSSWLLWNPGSFSTFSVSFLMYRVTVLVKCTPRLEGQSKWAVHLSPLPVAEFILKQVLHPKNEATYVIRCTWSGYSDCLNPINPFSNIKITM